MIKALKVISVSSLLLALLFATLYIVGSKEQAETIDSEPVKLNAADIGQQLLDNQSYVTYSHSDSNGHWFIDSSYSDEPILYVNDEMMQGLTESDKYIATYVDSDKWELVALESVR